MGYNIKEMTLKEARESILKDAPTEKARLLVSLAINAYYVYANYWYPENDINTRDVVSSIAGRDDGDDLTDFRISDVNAAVSYVNSVGCEALVKYIHIMFGATAMLKPYPPMWM